MKPLEKMLLLAAVSTAFSADAAEPQAGQKRDTTEFGVHDRPWADDVLSAADPTELRADPALSCAAGLEEAVRWIESAIEPLARGEDLPSVVRHGYIEATASLALLSQERARIEQEREALADAEALTVAAARRVREEIEALKTLKAEVAGMIETLEKKEDAHIDRLMTVYLGMQAKDAARLIAAADRMAAIDILSAMTERDAGALIARMDDESAADIMRLMSERGRMPVVEQTALDSY